MIPAEEGRTWQQMMFTGVGLLRLVSCSSPTTGNTPEEGYPKEDLRSRKFRLYQINFQLLLLKWRRTV